MSEEIKHTHQHEHHHDHEYTHDHEHSHDHEHMHHHKHSEGNKDLALLKYMVEHNEHHAKEVADMARLLRAAGQIQAAEELEAGVSDFKSGNLHLSKAYVLLKK